MPVNSVFNGEVVLNEHFDVISLVNFDQRTGLKIINEVDIASESI